MSYFFILCKDVCLACLYPTWCDGLDETGPHKPFCVKALSLVAELWGKD